MERKVSFYGTPLNKSLNDEQTNNDGPFQNRRARLNYQQTVRDSQGRQRFHGAFTGGFSAGYFNTVDSIEGFQPRQFVTSRGRKHDAGTSKFHHRPEDYMDEEDFGEFGIAPKKIRVIGSYSGNDQSSGSSLGNNSSLSRLIIPNSLSIGESILQHLSNGPGSTRIRVRDGHLSELDCSSSKNDFHGLGYKSLKSREVSSTFVIKTGNPLIAVLGEGKRLKISGEAFGSGVVEDEDLLMDAESGFEYDRFEDYKLRSSQPPKTKSLLKVDSYTSEGYHDKDGHFNLPGFILAKDLEASQISYDVQNYPKPIIPKDWKMPMRAKPYIPPTVISNTNAILDLQKSSSLFNRKFVQSTSSTACNNIETKAGLVLYSDLKANEPKVCDITHFSIDEREVPTISRQKIEWRPCSLLCKRFNVPNPYPDNLFTGIKPSNSIKDCDNEDEDTNKPQVCHQVASLELKRSIFNVRFTNKEEIRTINDRPEISDDDEPQIIELHQSEPSSSESEHDILEIPAEKKVPEIIVLSDSSSSSTGPQQDQASKEPDDDTYGPPLPPSLKNTGEQRSSRSRSSKKKKKSKKHKRSRPDSYREL